jgi:hypothetical protein
MLRALESVGLIKSSSLEKWFTSIAIKRSIQFGSATNGVELFPKLVKVLIQSGLVNASLVTRCSVAELVTAAHQVANMFAMIALKSEFAMVGLVLALKSF